MEGAPSSSDIATFRALRAEFSDFRIWREVVRGVIQYTARSLHLRNRLHTVVTKDLAELGDLLRDSLSGRQCDSPDVERTEP